MVGENGVADRGTVEIRVADRKLCMPRHSTLVKQVDR